MVEYKKLLIVLLVDDDEDDCLLVKDAFTENRIKNEVRCPGDGVELMDYLLHRGRYQEKGSAPMAFP
jgi:hypothetical protein